MDDRLLRGALAGIIAEVACAIINLTSQKLLHLAEVRWVQMLSHLVFGRAMVTPIDTVLGYLLCAALGGGLGIVLARFVVPKPGEGNYYFRALALGVGFMVVSYAIGNVTKTPTMTNIAPGTTITTFTSVTAWGLITADLMRRWDRAYSL